MQGSLIFSFRYLQEFILDYLYKVFKLENVFLQTFIGGASVNDSNRFEVYTTSFTYMYKKLAQHRNRGKHQARGPYTGNALKKVQ